jgi:hypothetical protein
LSFSDDDCTEGQKPGALTAMVVHRIFGCEDHASCLRLRRMMVMLEMIVHPLSLPLMSSRIEPESVDPADHHQPGAGGGADASFSGTPSAQACDVRLTGLPRGGERLRAAFAAAVEKGRTVDAAQASSSSFPNRANSVGRSSAATFAGNLISTSAVPVMQGRFTALHEALRSGTDSDSLHSLRSGSLKNVGEIRHAYHVHRHRALQRLYERGAVDVGTWERLPKTQKGSKAGGLFRAPDDSLHYVKFYPTADYPAHELAFLKTYALAGFDTVNARLAILGSRMGIAAHWRSDLQTGSLAALSQTDRLQLAELYQVSVMLDNVDFIGCFDNVGYSLETGRLVVIDAGASMLARSLIQLRLRPDESVRWFLEDPRYRRAIPRIGRLYDPLFKRDPTLCKQGARAVERIADEPLTGIFDAAAVRPALAARAVVRIGRRRDTILARYSDDIYRRA